MKARASISGFCPGALRPMAARDGLLVRIRPRLSRLSLAQLAAVTEAAAEFGNGSFTLTSRANIQIRGVSAAAHARMVEVLARADLVDEDAAVEAVRNVVVGPDIALGVSSVAALGLDLAGKIEEGLRTSARLRELPGKFGVSIMNGDGSDSSASGDATFFVGEAGIRLVLDGDANGCALFSNVDAATAGFQAVASEFLRLRKIFPEIRRLRQAVRLAGSEALLRAASPAATEHAPPAALLSPPVGLRGASFGIGFVFGEIGPGAARAVLRFMKRHGIGETAVSPGRTLVFPCREGTEADFRELARAVEGIVTSSDFRLRVHACAGAPFCASGEAASRRDAGRLLDALQQPRGFAGAIHVSGCAKKCAHPADAEIAAIASGGAYTILLRGEPRFAGVAPDAMPKAIAACVEEFA